MINVLVVEDDNIKFGALKAVVIASGVEERHVYHATNSTDAYRMCIERQFNLLLLDVNIPRRFDDKTALRGEGLSFLRRITREVRVLKPEYIVGVTAYDDVVEEFGEEFERELWSLVQYSEQSDRWKSQVAAKVDYVSALQRSQHFTDGLTYGVDVAVVCALDDPEWVAVQALPCEWQPLRLPHDHTRYITGTIETAAGSVSVVSAVASRMGMPAVSVLASKMITSFRPRFLGMTGICAGRASETRLGDAVIADPAYDWGSGKIDSKDKKPRFRPSPHQLDLDVDIRSHLEELFKSSALRAGIRDKCPPPPERGDLQVHIAPMASGASVVANAAIFDELLDNNRDVAALEMEAYGIFVAAANCAKPRPLPLVIKGVCDYADEEKKDNYQSFAAHISARCFYEAIISLHEAGGFF